LRINGISRGARGPESTRAVGFAIHGFFVSHYFGSKEKLYVSVIEPYLWDIRAQERDLELARLHRSRPNAPILIDSPMISSTAIPLFVKMTRNENLLEGRFHRPDRGVATSSHR